MLRQYSKKLQNIQLIKKKKALSFFDKSLLFADFLDHYDTALYGFLVPIMAPLFFPMTSSIASLIYSYSIYASSMLTYPLGTLLFCTLAMRKPIIQILYYSLMGLAFFTLGIGLLPSYESIGWLAPFGLLIGRMGQGIFVSGERALASLYILEGKPYQRSLEISRYYQIAELGGIISASFLMTLLVNIPGPKDFLWRIPFFIASSVGIIGFFLRIPDNANASSIRKPMHVLDVVKETRPPFSLIFSIAAIIGFSHITYTMAFIFLNSFIPHISTLSLQEVSINNSFLLVFDFLLIIPLGKWASRYRAPAIIKTVLYVMIVSSIPLFSVLQWHVSYGYLVFLRLWIIFWGVCYCCNLMVYLRSFCKGKYQYLWIGLGSMLGTAFIGHPTSAICFLLYKKLNWTGAPALYIIFSAFLAFIGQAWLQKYREKNMISLC